MSDLHCPINADSIQPFLEVLKEPALVPQKETPLGTTVLPSEANKAKAEGEDKPKTDWSKIIDAASTGFSSFFPGTGTSAAPAAAAPSVTFSIPSAPPKKPFPWGMVIGGVGLVAVLGTGVYFLTRD